MFISKRWHYKAVLCIALGTLSTVDLQLLISQPALTQTKPDAAGQRVAQSYQLVVRAGTTIPVEYSKAEKVIVTPQETESLTLTVARNVLGASGRVAIPVGSKIEGKLKPVSGGTQFVAQTLVLNSSNQRLSIDATSKVVTRRETITNKNNSDITKGAIVGAGAAALLGGIFGGRIKIGEVLGGGAAGALGGTLLRGNKNKEVVLIYPNTDLQLTLNADLVINRY